MGIPFGQPFQNAQRDERCDAYQQQQQGYGNQPNPAWSWKKPPAPSEMIYQLELDLRPPKAQLELFD